MKLRTKRFDTAEAADNFEVPEGARNFKIHAVSVGAGVVATWYERNAEERKWGSMTVHNVRPSLLALELLDTCTGCRGPGAKCRPRWAHGSKCCPNCSHGARCELVGSPQMTFRPQGIALLGVDRGTQIVDVRVGTMSIGASAEPWPGELFQGGPLLLDKLGELGIAELGELEGMVEPERVGKVIEALETYTPFVCRAVEWPTCQLGSNISVRLEGGVCRGAILWGRVASEYAPREAEPR